MKRSFLLLAALAIGCGGGESSSTLAIDGRINATPSIAADGAIVAIAWGAAAVDGGTGVFVAVSDDGGATFGAPVLVDSRETARLGGEFPPRVGVHRTDDGAAAITVVWTARASHDAPTTIESARSTDGGRTFSEPQALQDAGAAGARGWPALALASNGAAHAVWLDHRGLAGRSTGHHHADASGTVDGVAQAQKSALFYSGVGAGAGVRAGASAAAARLELRIAPGVCYCCKTAMATGPQGEIYAAWRHVYPRNLRDIAFTASRDGGVSFLDPVRVSEDGWMIEGCPDDGPAMAVDATGTIHIVWPSQVQGAEPRGAIFYATSLDGRTFSPRVEVPTLGSVKPAHPQIAIDAGGRILVAWDEQHGNARVAAVREVVPSDLGITFGDIARMNTEGAAYYPALAASGDRFVAVWSNAGDTTSIGVRAFPLAR